jgi:hypothetical protein
MGSRQPAAPSSRRWRLLLLASFFAVCGASRSALGLTQTELDTERSLWDSQHLTDYDYDFGQDCLCGVTGTSRVSVRGGVVVTGVPYDPVYAAHGIDVSSPVFYSSVDDMFSTLQSAVTHDAFLLNVQFDPTLGYPSSIEVKFDERVPDSYERLTASNLVAVPEPSAATLAGFAAGGLAFVVARCRKRSATLKMTLRGTEAPARRSSPAIL